MTDPASTHALHSKRARSRSRRRTGRKNLKFRFGLKVESLRRVAGRYRLRRRLSRSKASASAGWHAVVGRPRQRGAERKLCLPGRFRGTDNWSPSPLFGERDGVRGVESLHTWTCEVEKSAFARLLTRRRGKARDYASFASSASLLAPSRFQQTVCANDARFETTHSSRQRFCVRVMRSSVCVGRAVFRD
jgi:hypothetical protein